VKEVINEERALEIALVADLDANATFQRLLPSKDNLGPTSL
jgi:hypothetical protein